MLELLEVNVKKNYFDQVVFYQKIEVVDLIDMSYIFKEISGLVFVEKLMGCIFIGFYCWGKYFFVEMDNGDYVFFYFGMSGCFCYYDDFVDQFKYE